MSERREQTAENDRIRKVVADHFVMWQEGTKPRGLTPGAWVCACGLRFGFSDTAIDHVTEKIKEAGRFAEADKGRLWEGLVARCRRAEEMHAEASQLAGFLQARVADAQQVLLNFEQAAEAAPGHSYAGPWLAMVDDVRRVLVRPSRPTVSTGGDQRPTGCDCIECERDDKWCCRPCHEMARAVGGGDHG